MYITVAVDCNMNQLVLFQVDWQDNMYLNKQWQWGSTRFLWDSSGN